MSQVLTSPLSHHDDALLQACCILVNMLLNVWTAVKNVVEHTALLRLTLALQMMLKCADIGHLAAAPASHQRWAFQLEEEFFQQVSSCVGTKSLLPYCTLTSLQHRKAPYLIVAKLHSCTAAVILFSSEGR